MHMGLSILKLFSIQERTPQMQRRYQPSLSVAEIKN